MKPETFFSFDSVIDKYRGEGEDAFASYYHLIFSFRDLTAYPTWRKKVFSVDRCEYQNTMSINFTNLARLLSDTPQAAVLRELIVDR